MVHERENWKQVFIHTGTSFKNTAPQFQSMFIISAGQQCHFERPDLYWKACKIELEHSQCPAGKSSLQIFHRPSLGPLASTRIYFNNFPKGHHMQTCWHCEPRRFLAGAYRRGSWFVLDYADNRGCFISLSNCGKTTMFPQVWPRCNAFELHASPNWFHNILIASFWGLKWI